MITIKPSPIHGNGVFATEDIPIDTKIGELHGKRITLEEAKRADQRTDSVLCGSSGNR